MQLKNIYSSSFHVKEKFRFHFLNEIEIKKLIQRLNVIINLIEEWRGYLDKNFVVGAVLTDLSKAIDCIPHALLLAKLEAYGIGEKALSYIYLYLRNRNQGVHINDTKKNSQKIISGIPQGSITEPIKFKFLINNLLFFVSSASMFNFVDDNSLSSTAKTVTELKSILRSELEVFINWFKNNNMIVNPEKSQAIILDKQKHDYSN